MLLCSSLDSWAASQVSAYAGDHGCLFSGLPDKRSAVLYVFGTVISLIGTGFLLGVRTLRSVHKYCTRELTIA